MAYEAIERYIERLLNESAPDRPIWNLESLRQGKPPHWNYIDGCMSTALWNLYEETGDTRYASFVERFIDFYVSDDGTLLGYRLQDYNLDNVCEGRVLFDLFPYTGKEKYRRAIELLYRQLVEQPRNRQGSFWHKQIYPNQVWLDGLYMAQVFYLRYTLAFQNGQNIPDILAQFENVRKHMYDAEKHLYRHGYDCTRRMFWADGNGCSKCCWLRAIGWFAVALADVIGYLPETEQPARTRLSSFLSELLGGVSTYADDKTGLFFQVVDQGNRTGNYPETSGSAMLAYAMLKGARLGAVDASYAAAGKRVFDGICRTYLHESADGAWTLGGICLVAGLGPDGNRRRDGSYEYYVSEPVVENDAKGVAPFLLAYTELLRLR